MPLAPALSASSGTITRTHKHAPFLAVFPALLLALLLLAPTTGCGSPPGSGTIDGIELGLKIGMHLENLARTLKVPGKTSGVNFPIDRPVPSSHRPRPSPTPPSIN